MVPLSGRDLIWPDGLPFRSFDPGNTGKIGELQFRKIMKSKEAIPDEDVEEMLSGGQATKHEFQGSVSGDRFFKRIFYLGLSKSCSCMGLQFTESAAVS
jgi:hypothetical protein